MVSSFFFSLGPLTKHFGIELWPSSLLLVLEHLLLTMPQRLFYDIPISHSYDSRIEVNSDLIAGKSMKIIKRSTSSPAHLFAWGRGCKNISENIIRRIEQPVEHFLFLINQCIHNMDKSCSDKSRKRQFCKASSK